MHLLREFPDYVKQSFYRKIEHENHKHLLKSHVQGEFHLSMIEVRSSPNANISDHRTELLEIVSEVARIARRHGSALAALGTHLFSDWSKQGIQPGDRYSRLVQSFPGMKRGPIASLHIHISLPDFAEAVRMHNLMRHYLPHFMAISGNSPFFNLRHDLCCDVDSGYTKMHPHF